MGIEEFSKEDCTMGDDEVKEEVASARLGIEILNYAREWGQWKFLIEWCNRQIH